MIWIKLGILLIGFTNAALLPYSIKKALEHVKIDLKKQTLSFFSNKSLYGKRFVKGYKVLLFTTAILTYLFFWLLTLYYDLGEYEKLMGYIDLGFTLLTLLAFVPHNLQPYSLKSLSPSLQRLMHNLLAVLVFISLPSLIITFQASLLSQASLASQGNLISQTAVLSQTVLHSHFRFLGITGMIIIGGTIISVAISMLRNGITGASELLFINGISLWTIFVTIITFLS